jgi:hypothetical protein
MNNENPSDHPNQPFFPSSSDQNQMISLASAQITNEKLNELLSQIEDYERVSVVNTSFP